jgi:transcriptional regulator with GAF, ATPase, and Fis domain
MHGWNATRTINSTLPPATSDEDETTAIPGAVLVSCDGTPLCGAIAIGEEPLQLGRGTVGDVVIEDNRMSRRHVRVAFDAAHGRFVVEDLGSRNGFTLGITKLAARSRSEAEPESVLGLGNSLFLLVADIRPFRNEGVTIANGHVIGPRLRACYRQIELAAGAGDTLHITGESGAGKEAAARAFHEHGPTPHGPLIAVNCAAIPEGVAERLLFGARKGAFSGASDAEGYVQAASGGTLFLDEVGELDPNVQAKLLRVLESRQVLPVGATRPQSVDIRIVSATHRDLRVMVGQKRFREDLFYRIARPHVRLLPLRERREEIPTLARLVVERTATGLRPRTSLLAACMDRPWPGNVRELLREIQDATSRARGEDATTVEERHLEPSAGMPFTASAVDEVPSTSTSEPAPLPSRDTIEAALRDAGGQVQTAARTLGLHRNQLRRWLARTGLDPRSFIDPR